MDDVGAMRWNRIVLGTLVVAARQVASPGDTLFLTGVAGTYKQVAAAAPATGWNPSSIRKTGKESYYIVPSRRFRANAKKVAPRFSKLSAHLRDEFKG